MMFFFSKIDYRKYQKLYKIALIGSLVLNALVPLIGTEVNGAKRWIRFFGMSIQPSEIAKIGLIIFYAGLLTKDRDKLKSLKTGFLKPIFIVLPLLFILFIFQDHLSACVVIIAITAVMMLVAGTKISHFLTLGSIGVAGAGIRNVSTC